MRWTGSKKNLASGHEERKALIDREAGVISLSRQAELLGISRSSLYYRPAITSEDEKLMRLIDEQYTLTPFYGSRRMSAWLQRAGYQVNRKRAQRLMREMGIEAIYPKPDLSWRARENKIYPYLLRGVAITCNNQVWSTDITYIRLNKGWLYLVAIMDWYSRYVISWELSDNMEVDFCISALDKALAIGKPEIFNSDQGSQFTSQEFTTRLEQNNIQISMDGKGRAIDNIFTERLWRSLKYEEVYLKEYQNQKEAKLGVGNYLNFYNQERLHQSLGYKTPKEIFWGLN